MTNELPERLLKRHTGIYEYEDSYRSRANLVRAKNGIHINVINGSTVISIPDDVMKAVMEGESIDGA